MVGITKNTYILFIFFMLIVVTGCAKRNDEISARANELVVKSAEAINKGEFENARSLLEKAIKLKPDFAEACVSHGMASVCLWDYVTAKNSYEQALSFHAKRYQNEPSNANHVQQQIFVLVLLGRSAEAKQLLTEAQSRHSGDNQLNTFARGFSSLKESMAKYTIPAY